MKFCTEVYLSFALQPLATIKITCWQFKKKKKMAKKKEPDTLNTSIDEVLLKDIQPNIIVSKLPFNNLKCPLFISQNGNATALYRYSNSGPFIELFDPLNSNLIPALKYSIIQGIFCIFNFGLIDNINEILHML